MRVIHYCLTAVAIAAASPVAAANVDLSATLVNSCTLTVGTSGVMTPASNGTRISSEEVGGIAATLNVIALGAIPTISFSAPSLIASPAGWSGSPTNEIRYTSTGGANQAYTSSSSNAPLAGLIDSFTINGRVSNANGFAAGNYTLRTVVTCGQ